ncbi:MAG: tetratricopeptide repeat protein [Syntrophales bacterium]|nr:tetratricopeptide repeat protein [Syntrophales bacterium]
MSTDLLKDEHEEREKKRKKKVAITIAAAVLLMGVLLFFDTFYHLISTGHIRKGSLLDKIGGRLSKLSPQEEQVLMGEAKRLFDEGKVDLAREKILNLVQRSPSSEALYLAGLIYLRQGNVKGAYDYLRESVRLNPQNLSAQEKLGEIFVLIGDYASAKRQASILLEKGGSKENALLLEAEIALREGSPTLALKKASEALAGRNPGAQQLIFVASLYWRLGELSKAKEIIGSLRPEVMDAASLLALARYYTYTGEDKKAEEIYTSSIAKYSSYPEILYDYGLFLFGRRRFAEALDNLEKAHKAMPGAAIVTYHLGQAALAANKKERVKSITDELFERDPRSVLAWRLKGEYHLALGDRRGAIEAFQKVVQFIPEAAYIYAVMAELYLKEGEYGLAEKYARQAVNLGERSPAPRLVLGDLYYGRGKWEEAKHFYYEVLKDQPAHLAALLMAGDCELNLGKLNQAEALYRKAMTLYPQAGFIQARLARLKLAAGDRPGSLALARSYYEKHPKETKAVTEYANALILNGKLAEAEKVIEDAIKVKPDEGHLLLAAGDLQLLKGDQEKAVRIYTRAEAIPSQDPSFIINIAARYVAIGRKTEAQRAYLQAYQRFPTNIHVLNEVAWFFVDTLGQPDRATEIIEILKKRGEGANEKDTVGWYYYLKGNDKMAEYYIMEARKLDPQNPIIHAHYVLILDRTARHKEAREEAVKVLERLPAGELKTRLLQIAAPKS